MARESRPARRAAAADAPVAEALARVLGTTTSLAQLTQGAHWNIEGESFFDSLTFRSDGKVDVVLVGVRHEGAYEAESGGVTITAPNGERTSLTLGSNGCLTHPIAGTYCLATSR